MTDPTTTPDADADAAAAWRALTAGLDALATRLLADDFPSTPRGRDEAFRHLAQQATCWLTWAYGHGDPTAPAFQRQNDLVTQWGGPNADNTYRHARVDPGCEYRIHGRMHSCEDFVVAIRTGFRHTDSPATLVELTASEIGIGEGGEFEVLLGGTGAEPNRMALPEGAIMCSIREYYFDWRPAEPALFTIERLGGTPTRAPATYPDAAAEALDLTERSIVFWNDYMISARERQVDNTFGARIDVPRGLQLQQFGFNFYDLAPDEALVLDFEMPDARYWSLQLYKLAWFTPYDIGRTTSLNHAQTATAPDGRVQVVVAHDDPGVPNWLDTQGRANGLVNLRHFWGTVLPRPVPTVVAAADVRAALPEGTPTVTPAERATTVRARRHHLAWRFRT
jgi:hypothetical protein